MITMISQRLWVLWVIGVAMLGTAARADEAYQVELRVVEATPGEGSKASIDPQLAALAKDLRALPFGNYKVVDAHSTAVHGGERVSLEIPSSAKGRRFLVVAAKGRTAGNKLRFQLGIEALRFDTVVSVPDGGTIIVGGPRDAQGRSLLFAFTARSSAAVPKR